MFLGNLDAKRDWGHAREYVEGMWRMVQQETPDDYVLATGRTVTVRHFVDVAFAESGVTLRWEGEGRNEKGFDAADGRLLVQVDPRYFRPTEVDRLIGDPAKAREKLGWKHSISVEELAREMVRADLKIMSDAPIQRDA